jgi:hypothetical protein
VGRAAFEVTEDEKLVHVHNKEHNLGNGKSGQPVLKDVIPTALNLRGLGCRDVAHYLY